MQKPAEKPEAAETPAPTETAKSEEKPAETPAE
jgi:hypothetical protein